MKAKLLCDAGEIANGEAVEVVTRAEAKPSDEPRKQSGPEYKVRDDVGHEEAVATRDLQIVR